MSSMDGRPTIRCFTGIPFDFENPDPKSIQFDDVAQGLSNACRFAGQCRRFYSVAEHSVLVANILKFRGYEICVQQLGLMHDAHEAYTGDMTSPLKKLCPDFRRIADAVQEAALRRFKLEHVGEHGHMLVKIADLAARAIEGRDLTDAGESEYGPVPEDLQGKKWRVVGYTAPSARHLFVENYKELFPARRRA